MIRADPVQPSRDRVLGFVLIFSDITDRKAAEIARGRFQESIIQSNRIKSVRLDSKTDLVYQNLLSSVVENAQLAALEITYGVETGRIAEMLESVRNSTLRTAEVLEHLIWHSSRTSGRRQEAEIARRRRGYSAAVAAADPFRTADCTAQDNSIFRVKATAPSSTIAWPSRARAPARSRAMR